MQIKFKSKNFNLNCRFKYDENGGNVTVYSIGGIANDAERGLYWAPYTSGNDSKLVPFEGGKFSFLKVENFILSKINYDTSLL